MPSLSPQQAHERNQRERQVKLLLADYANWSIFDLLDRLQYYKVHTRVGQIPRDKQTYGYHIEAIQAVIDHYEKSGC